MNRSQPTLTLQFPELKTVKTGHIKKVYRLALLTPMVGGGTTPYQANKDQPIRSSGIKQQLRFWWRAIQPCSWSLAELRENEDRLFGSTQGASPLRLRVENEPNTTKEQSVNAREDLNGLPPYALFPLTQQPKGVSPSLISQTHFSLTLEFTGDKTAWVQIDTAVRLWVLLGGLGARTHRGAGSLMFRAPAGGAEASDILSLEELSTLLETTKPAEPCTAPFPSLHGARYVYPTYKPGNSDPKQAWSALIYRFQQLRQSRTPREATGTGRSYWPEPDAIRNLSNWRGGLHRPDKQASWFARAAYGLPLIFQFPNNSKYGDDEPRGLFTLAPQGAGRWPSPLLLKLIQTPKGFRPLVLILNTPTPDQMEISDENSNKVTINFSLRQEGSVSGKSPLKAQLAKGLNLYEATLHQFAAPGETLHTLP